MLQGSGCSLHLTPCRYLPHSSVLSTSHPTFHGWERPLWLGLGGGSLSAPGTRTFPFPGTWYLPPLGWGCLWVDQYILCGGGGDGSSLLTHP